MAEPWEGEGLGNPQIELDRPLPRWWNKISVTSATFPNPSPGRALWRVSTSPAGRGG